MRKTTKCQKVGGREGGKVEGAVKRALRTGKKKTVTKGVAKWGSHTEIGAGSCTLRCTR